MHLCITATVKELSCKLNVDLEGIKSRKGMQHIDVEDFLYHMRSIVFERTLNTRFYFRNDPKIRMTLRQDFIRPYQNDDQ